MRPRKSSHFVRFRAPLGLLPSLALALAMTMVHGPSQAEPDAANESRAHRARVVLTVGSRTITVGELEDYLAAIPPYQLSMFGASKDAIARAYLDQVLARDLTLVAGAEARGLDKQLPTSQLLARSLSTTTLRKSHTGYPSAAAVPPAEVAKYYDDNRSRFDSPERINLWRILCKSQDEANAVLETARRDSSIAKFNDLARDHSIDKATNMRGGNLGFVGPDGASNEAGVKVDPGLVKAAQTVKDGELVPRAVPEGNAFAVIWRRGTVPPSRRSLDEATAQIRSAIYRERTEASEKQLIDGLRAKNVKDVNYGLLGTVELRPFDAGLSAPRPPAGSAPPPRPSR